MFFKAIEQAPQRPHLKPTKPEKVLPSPERIMLLEQHSEKW